MANHRKSADDDKEPLNRVRGWVDNQLRITDWHPSDLVTPGIEVTARGRPMTGSGPLPPIPPRETRPDFVPPLSNRVSNRGTPRDSISDLEVATVGLHITEDIEPRVSPSRHSQSRLRRSETNQPLVRSGERLNTPNLADSLDKSTPTVLVSQPASLAHGAELRISRRSQSTTTPRPFDDHHTSTYIAREDAPRAVPRSHHDQAHSVDTTEHHSLPKVKTTTHPAEDRHSAASIARERTPRGIPISHHEPCSVNTTDRHFDLNFKNRPNHPYESRERQDTRPKMTSISESSINTTSLTPSQSVTLAELNNATTSLTPSVMTPLMPKKYASESSTVVHRSESSTTGYRHPTTPTMSSWAPNSTASTSNPQYPVHLVHPQGGPKKWYTVIRGRRTGVFDDWLYTDELVGGVPHRNFKGFGSEDAAQKHYTANVYFCEVTRTSREDDRKFGDLSEAFHVNWRGY